MNEKKAYNQLDHSGTYREDDTSVTLTVLGGTYGGSEVLIVQTCYRKTSHPRNANEAQGYAETEVNDTLNIFDNGEMRTPTLIVEEIKAISFQERAGREGGQGNFDSE